MVGGEGGGENDINTATAKFRRRVNREAVAR
jgi:hypothetical protein